jgi:hypothetical protein
LKFLFRRVPAPVRSDHRPRFHQYRSTVWMTGVIPLK